MATSTLAAELRNLISICGRLEGNQKALRSLMRKTGDPPDEFLRNLHALLQAARRITSVGGAESHIVKLNKSTELLSFDNTGRCYRSDSAGVIPLMGKPLRLLRLIVERGGAVTRDDIAELLWPVNSLATNEGKGARSRNWAKYAAGDEAVRGIVFKVRRALRAAFTLPKDYDPIPKIDISPNLAWELRLENLGKNAKKTLTTRA
jgi:hypothetical protein